MILKFKTNYPILSIHKILLKTLNLCSYLYKYYWLLAVVWCVYIHRPHQSLEQACPIFYQTTRGNVVYLGLKSPFCCYNEAICVRIFIRYIDFVLVFVTCVCLIWRNDQFVTSRRRGCNVMHRGINEIVQKGKHLKEEIKPRSFIIEMKTCF